MSDKWLRFPLSPLLKESSPTPYIFCLPSGGRDVLLSMAERFDWRIWLDEENERVNLPDAPAAIMADTVFGLIEGVSMADFINQIIEAIQGMGDICQCECHTSSSSGNGGNEMCNNCGCGCGCGNGSLPPSIPPDEEYIPPPPPPYTEPPPTPADNWKCASSHQAVENWASYYNNVANDTDAGIGLQQSLYSAALTNGWIVAASAWVAAIVLLLLSVTVSPVLRAVRDWYIFHSANLVCLLFLATSPIQAKNNYLSYVAEHAPGGLVGYIIRRILEYTAEMSDWNKLYIAYSFNISAENSDEECEGCGSPIEPPEPPVEPPDDPEILSGITFNNMVAALVNLGDLEAKEGEVIRTQTVYGLRSMYQSGATWSGHTGGFSLAVNEDITSLDALANLTIHLYALEGHSGESGLDGDVAYDPYDEPAGTNRLWLDLEELPHEVAGFKRVRAYDEEGQFDVYFWFEYQE